MSWDGHFNDQTEESMVFANIIEVGRPPVFDCAHPLRLTDNGKFGFVRSF